MANVFDENILKDDKNICKNIDMLTPENEGMFFQNILNGLRNFVEDIIERIYSDVFRIEPNNHEDRQKAIKYIKSKYKYREIKRFHDCLEVSVSHATIDEDNAARMMYKYYYYLFKLRNFVKKEYNLDILHNLEKIKMTDDSSTKEYYQLIAREIEKIIYNSEEPVDRFYINKKIPFYINRKIYYQYTIVPADDYSSKFNQFLAFSDQDIPDFYAIKLNFIDTSINVINRNMPIRIINDYKVAIRNSELKHLGDILGLKNVNPSNKEYYLLMDYLTDSGYSLTEICDFNDVQFNEFKNKFSKLKTHDIIPIMTCCRELTKKNLPGVNTVRYLIYKIRNKVIREQKSDYKNEEMSNLYLDYGCLPFENMPFDASLKKHNTKIYDLINCISMDGRDGEIVSRRMMSYLLRNNQMIIPTSEFEDFDNLENIVEDYNRNLPKKHKSTRNLVIENNYIYKNGEVDTCYGIINNLINRIGHGDKDYKNRMDGWINAFGLVDSDEKKFILLNMFDKSNLALVYGAAGTGKTTLVKHLADFFYEDSKLFLANTNSAVQNLRRQVLDNNSSFSTIESSKNLVANYEFDIVFIDECTTIDNRKMYELLCNLKCNYLVLVGDIYQLKSIEFGNWFGLSRYFLGNNIYELKKPYRNKNKNLFKLWESVRELKDNISEIINLNNYSSNYNDSLFQRSDDDEIILCLNYDGLYGINNINRFLQEDNSNKAYMWDNCVYKEGDPIVFYENNPYSNILYNNLKGKIIKIIQTTNYIQFDIQIQIYINSDYAKANGFIVISGDENSSIVRIKVKKFIDNDNDEKSKNEVVPFQVAYAISIHKAQGLEYESVKIVLTNEIEELITLNVFYTAITRARSKLKIYWTPKAQEYIIDNLEKLKDGNDAAFLSRKYGLKKNNLKMK